MASTVTIPPRCDIINMTTIQGNPVDETFAFSETDWSGTYTAQIYTPGTVPVARADLQVTVLYDGTNTQVSLYADTEEMSTVAPGNYRWVMRNTEGYTPARGTFIIQEEAGPVA